MVISVTLIVIIFIFRVISMLYRVSVPAGCAFHFHLYQDAGGRFLVGAENETAKKRSRAVSRSVKQGDELVEIGDTAAHLATLDGILAVLTADDETRYLAFRREEATEARYAPRGTRSLRRKAPQLPRAPAPIQPFSHRASARSTVADPSDGAAATGERAGSPEVVCIDDSDDDEHAGAAAAAVPSSGGPGPSASAASGAAAATSGPLGSGSLSDEAHALLGAFVGTPYGPGVVDELGCAPTPA